MWLATGLGFFSIVRKEGKFYVRARSVQDLRDLLKATELSNKIYQWQGTDYIARIIVNDRELAKIKNTLFDGINYDNFKDSIKVNKKQKDKLGFYGRMWGVMWDYQLKFERKFNKKVGTGWQYGQLLPLRDDVDAPNDSDIPF